MDRLSNLSGNKRLKIEFSTYLHDSDMSFHPADYLDEDWANMSRSDREAYLSRREVVIRYFENNREKPFYEIELRCTLDLDTFEIEILGLAE